MGKKSLLMGGLILIWIILIILGLALCNAMKVTQGGQYQQIGEELGSRGSHGSNVSDYKYVADPATKQYWPNLPQYVERIKGQKVWIIDDATLAEFKGYTPGPL